MRVRKVVGRENFILGLLWEVERLRNEEQEIKFRGSECIRPAGRSGVKRV